MVKRGRNRKGGNGRWSADLESGNVSYDEFSSLRSPVTTGIEIESESSGSRKPLSTKTGFSQKEMDSTL